MTISIEV